MSRENIFADLHSPYPTAPIPGAVGDAPPPYAPHYNSPYPNPSDAMAGQWFTPLSNQAMPVPSVGYVSLGMKLSCMDFVPQVTRKRMFGKNDYESFSILLQRANMWLEEHHDIQLVSCETVTWHGTSANEIFSDNSVFRKQGVVTYLRGLRFWYLARSVPSPCRTARVTNIINCRTVVARPTETFTELLARTNEQITTDSGNVISVETVRFGTDGSAVNTELTSWREDLRSTRIVLFAIRVYTQLAVKQDNRQTIGYQDFVPSRTNRSKENVGFELYSDVMDRAARWIARQQGVRFTNIQTVNMKIKKIGDSSFEQRCKYTSHGTRLTKFLSVTRVYFVIEQGSAPMRPEIPCARLTYRTFHPALVTAATANEPAMYEGLRAVLDRVNHWLQVTGASVFALETVPVRLPASSQKSNLGPEATFVPSMVDSTQAGRFLFNIRLFLHGDYQEPPGAVILVAPPAAIVY